MSTAGHLFVVHGRLEAFSCDAVVVPTSAGFSIRRHWRPVCRIDADSPFPRPASWGAGSVEPMPSWEEIAFPRPWFVDVVSARGPGAMGEVAVRAVMRIAADHDGRLARSQERAGRARPLVALPVIGTAGAGHDQDRGIVIRSLLDRLTDAAKVLAVDVVIVASSRSDYAALQAFRRQDVWDGPLGPDHLEVARDLGDKAATGELALFLGAGVSVGAGLPSWSGLLDELRSDSAVGAALQDVDDDRFNKLGPLEQAELIEVALHRAARDDDSVRTSLTSQVAQIIGGYQARPSLAHA